MNKVPDGDHNENPTTGDHVIEGAAVLAYKVDVTVGTDTGATTLAALLAALTPAVTIPTNLLMLGLLPGNGTFTDVGWETATPATYGTSPVAASATSSSDLISSGGRIFPVSAAVAGAIKMYGASSRVVSVEFYLPRN